MNKPGLILAAGRLADISAEAVRAFEGQADACAVELSTAMRRFPDLADFIGEGNAETMDTNHVNHFRYMSSAAALFDPTSFVETVLWVLRTYKARGFSARYWKVMLPEAEAILGRRLEPEHFEMIRPFYAWLQENIDAFDRLSEAEDTAFERMGGLHERGC